MGMLNDVNNNDCALIQIRLTQSKLRNRDLCVKMAWYQTNLEPLFIMSNTSDASGAPLSPLAPQPAATFLASSIPQNPIKLDGTNFLLWKTLTLPILSGLNLHTHLDESAQVPEMMLTKAADDKTGDDSDASRHTVPNPAYHAWWTQDQRVLGALLSSMSPEIASQMVGRTSAAQVWSALHAMFSTQSRATIRHTRLQLQTMKKKDMSAADYFHKMKALSDTLASIGSPLTDDEMIDYILARLGPQFGPLAASLTIVNKTVSLTDFYAYLLSFEAMQEQQNQGDDWSSSANSVSRQSHTSGRRSPQQSDSQKKGSQPRSNQSPGGSHHGGRGSGNRNRNGGGRYRPKCQICHLFGHEALNCHNRFNEAYNSEETRTANTADRRHNSDTQWYQSRRHTN